MTVLAILRDAWFFYFRHLGAIIRLCLPLIVIESCAKLAVGQWLGKDILPAQELLIGLAFYPLYAGALILFLDARSRGQAPSAPTILFRTLALWPALAVLSALGTLLILLGASLFILPGIWIMVRIAFAEYLLVLRGATPLTALRESLLLTRDHFFLLLGCVLAVMVPLWLLEVGLASQLLSDSQPTLAPLPQVLFDSLLGVLQLLPVVVMFRCYMLCVGTSMEDAAGR